MRSILMDTVDTAVDTMDMAGIAVDTAAMTTAGTVDFCEIFLIFPIRLFLLN